jgi:hypothetical protein
VYTSFLINLYNNELKEGALQDGRAKDTRRAEPENIQTERDCREWSLQGFQTGVPPSDTLVNTSKARG